MQTSDIQKRIDGIATAMLGRTKPRTIHFTLDAHGSPHVYISHNPKMTDSYHDEVSAFFKLGDRGSDTIDAILSKAEAYVAALPTREEADLALFRDKLADTIEHGKRVGIDVEDVNPLIEAMKRLSENALTHQPA